MTAASLLRAAASRPATAFFRANLVQASRPLASRAGLLVATTGAGFSTSARLRSEHQEETFEEFTAR